MCYDNRLMEYILDNYKITKIKWFPGELYLLKENNIAIIGNFGMGSPIAAALLEELIALGVKKFISIGTAGTLQKDIDIGELVVCERAIRDEGTSYHYLKPSKYAYASKSMTKKIIDSLNKFKKNYYIGASWTIDAPYKETVAEARHYQKEGVMTVEMEASALFSVAQFRNVEIGAIFTISDSLAELEWNPRFHLKKTKKGLELLYDVAVDALLN